MNMYLNLKKNIALIMTIILEIVYFNEIVSEI